MQANQLVFNMRIYSASTSYSEGTHIIRWLPELSEFYFNLEVTILISYIGMFCSTIKIAHFTKMAITLRRP